MKGKVITVTYHEAKEFLLPKHYSGRTPSISYAFGWVVDEELVAVCTFGKPASNNLCTGVCGKKWSSRVFELNRLCRVDHLTYQLSAFVSACLRRLSGDNLIIVSYADTRMDHKGYIYQATNFLYTGSTKRRTEQYTEGNKHSRHSVGKDQGTIRKVRSAKHRYVYFAMRDKGMKKEARGSLNYAVEEYPKGVNKNYSLGDYLQPELIHQVTDETSRLLA